MGFYADHTAETPMYGEYVPSVRNEQSLSADLLPQQFRVMWDGIANDPNLDWHDSEVLTKIVFDFLTCMLLGCIKVVQHRKSLSMGDPVVATKHLYIHSHFD